MVGFSIDAQCIYMRLRWAPCAADVRPVFARVTQTAHCRTTKTTQLPSFLPVRTSSLEFHTNPKKKTKAHKVSSQLTPSPSRPPCIFDYNFSASSVSSSLKTTTARSFLACPSASVPSSFPVSSSRRDDAEREEHPVDVMKNHSQPTKQPSRAPLICSPGQDPRGQAFSQTTTHVSTELLFKPECAPTATFTTFMFLTSFCSPTSAPS